MSAAAQRQGRSTSTAPRQAQALFFRAIVSFVTERGLLGQVVERVSEPTRWVLERPPWIGRWLPSLPVDEIETALQDLGGAELNYQLGLYVARNLVDRRLEPVIGAIFSALGRSPESLFRSLNLCFALATRGINFAYVPEGPEEANVVSHFRGPGTPEGALHALRGALQYGFDVVGRKGSVGLPVRVAETENGLTVRYPVQWG